MCVASCIKWRLNRFFTAALLGVIALVPTVPAQQAAPDDLAKGKSLLARLRLSSASDPSGDDAIFSQTGLEESQRYLLAVTASGQTPSATNDDWAAMHRAIDALIELNVGQQQLFKASIFANLQDAAYRNNEGDYVAAVAAARQALDLQQRSGQTQTLSIPWENLGNDLIHLGRIEEGVTALYQARTLLQDPTTSLAADIRRRIIAIESSRGNMAIAYTESAVFLRDASLSTPAAFRAAASLAAANLAIDDHRYDDAIARVHAALSAIKGAPDAALTAYQAIDVLLALGMEAMQTMPYDQALVLCDHLDKDFPGLPISVSGFARSIANHRRRLAGEFDLVLRDDAGELERARNANDLSAQLSALLSTAVDYAYLRESTQQVAALRQAADILHTPAADGVSPLLRFRLVVSLGAAQLARGDLRSARAAYTEAISGIEAVTSAQMRAQLGDLYGDAQLGMAFVNEQDGDLKTARDLLQQALSPPVGSLGSFTRSTVLLQSARLEQKANQHPEEAVRLYLEAIAALHQEKDVNTEVYARLQLVQYLATRKQENAAQGALAGSPADSALTMAREQLELARSASASASVGLADSTWRVQFLQGVLDEKTGDKAAAIKAYSAAVDALSRIRAGLSEEEERESFIDASSVQELYRRQVQLLTAAGERDKAWEFLERDKARSFLESLSGRHFSTKPAVAATPAAKGATANIAQLDEQILAARLALSPENEAALRDSGHSPEALQAKLTSLEADFALARQQKSLAGSRAIQPLSLVPISLAATEARLPAHTALIEYAILDQELAAFVVTHTSAIELHWAADTGSLPTQLRHLSTQLSSLRTSPEDLYAQLASTSETLLGPVVRALAPDIDTLVIVPTQTLSLVPFQALPLPLPKSSSAARGFVKEDAALDDPTLRTLVIDRYAVTYLPSASTLQFLHFGPPSASSDLFLGAIGDQSVEGLAPLPGTLEETAAIQKLYPRAIRVTGSAFTHDVALKALEQHQEVHFATHGLFETQAPLFSALITAPAGGQPSRLSLYEVMDLDLKAKLVILSACQTDLGQITGGDEIEGLTRTFLQAGAENVVSSLWSVSDESTALLMESLHAHLRAGESTPLALRHAELQVRRKFPQPFYWAAFVDTGVR